MMESLVENFKTGKMIRPSAYFFSNQKNYHREKENDPRHLWAAAGIGVVLENDAQRGGEVLKQMDQFKLKKEPRLNWGPNLSLEWKLEKVFKMNTGNLKKFLHLYIVTANEKSNSNPRRKAWYSIDLRKMRCEGDDWVVGKIDLKVRKIPKTFPYPSICVSLESVIYIICEPTHREPKIIRMYYLDTSNPENEWLEGPSMKVVGDIGSAVVHEGKIYVFGCFVEYIEDNNPCYGKVYDPVLNTWEPLSDPPTNLDELQGKFIGSYDDRKILEQPCSWEVLYAYDVVDKSWEVLDRDFGFRRCRGVIMDDVLYVFEYVTLEICGYDLVQLKWLKPIHLDHLEWFSRIEGTVPHEAFFFKVEANVLCLVYFDPTGREGLDIYCKTFTIKKIMQEDGDVRLEAEVFSSTIYNLGLVGHCPNYVVV